MTAGPLPDDLPTPPPVRGEVAHLVLGILNKASDFGLWLSPHILDGTRRVLVDGYGWSGDEAAKYHRRLLTIAGRGGGIVTPTTVVADCVDWEDNRILELAADSAAILVVSNDEHLLRLSPWRGIPILEAKTFVLRVDAMRRVLHRERQLEDPGISL